MFRLDNWELNKFVVNLEQQIAESFPSEAGKGKFELQSTSGQQIANRKSPFSKFLIPSKHSKLPSRCFDFSGTKLIAVDSSLTS